VAVPGGLLTFTPSAQRFFIISEIFLRASGDILRRRRVRPAPLAPPDASVPLAPPLTPLMPALCLSRAACAVNAASRSRVCAISRSIPPMAQPISSADFISTLR